MKKFTSLLIAAIMVLTIAIAAIPVSADPAAGVVITTPLLDDAVFADLSSFVAEDPEGKDTSYLSRTNADGWKVTSARSDVAEYTGSAPMITLNGKTSAPGTLTSAVIKGGMDKLAFNYGFAFSDTQFSITINIKKEDGTIIKSETLQKTDLTKETVYSFTMDVNTTEDVVLEIVNNCLTATDKNKDRLGIWNLCWNKVKAAPETTAPETTTAPEATTAPETTAPDASSNTGDNSMVYIVAIAVIAVFGLAAISVRREN